jgi:hypothetical protein
MMSDEPTFRFEKRYSLRHTDSFGGTPFVHGGVLLALTQSPSRPTTTPASRSIGTYCE